MRLVSNRSARRTIDAQGSQIRNHHQVLDALVKDEQLTRRRVDALEAFRNMTLWERLRWLVRGYSA